MQQDFRVELLEQLLRNYLGNIDPESMARVRSRLQWIEISAGETLMTQGEPGDSMYMSISGRLRAYVRDNGGEEKVVREMSRGQIIGEMSMYTDEPRSATVVAVRDSVLVKLAKSEFPALLASSPEVSLALPRGIINRLQNPLAPGAVARSGVFAVLPISAGVQNGDFCRRLAAHLRGIGRVEVIDAERLERDLEQPGVAHAELTDAGANRRISMYLDRIHAVNDLVLLVADDRPSAWTWRCSRQCDEMLLLADAAAPPQLHDIEVNLLMKRRGRAEAAEILVLLHQQNARSPSGTGRWLARRPVSNHVHIRHNLERDMARLARLVSGTAVGLVLGGGGARGMAHLGIYRALRERHIDVDWVGGTSVGAVMAALVAADLPIEETLHIARESFSRNPTSDFNAVPVISLIKGRRLRRIVDTTLARMLGPQPDIEDLWKNYYCIASNYSQAHEEVLERGSLARSILASIAIPGALPPQIQDGNLLCDGGTFNNFPVDVMRRMPGIGKVIGVDLGFRKYRRIEHQEMPDNWTLLRDRFRPRQQRRFRLPSLMSYLMNVTILYSTSRRREYLKLTDLYFNPELPRIGMLQWDQFDNTVEQGYAHAKKLLDGLSPDQLKPYLSAIGGAI